MRVWVDLTNSPHVLVMRPVIELLRAEGHDVRGDGARLRADARAVRAPRRRAHGDRPPPRRARRSPRPPGWPRARWRSCAGRGAGAPRAGRFDIALGHGSNDVSVAAALLRIPSSTMFDYEWATVQHNDQLPAGRGGRRAGGDPARAPAPLRRARQAAPLRGPEGGVLPRRLRARRRRCSAELGLDRGAPDRRRPHAAGGLALPPLPQRPVRRRARAPRGRRARRGPAAGRAAARRRPARASWPACRASSSPSTRSTRSR